MSTAQGEKSEPLAVPGPEEKIGGARASDVRVEGIFHSYSGADVLHGIDLEIEHGELMTLLGPSGSGKSTLLRIIGGLEHPREGRVTIGGEDVTSLPPERREVGIVFQNYALFPHMTIAENVTFPLRMRRLDRRKATRRAEAMLELVGLDGMAGRRPAELSGGQQQRVAVARALVFEPRVLLLDEPFGALDRRLREQLGLEVRRVQRELGITTIFVTHDQDEAFTMSTRIAVMGEGHLLQVDAPTGIYRAPRQLEVARYLGNLNEFPVVVAGAEDGAVVVEGPGGLKVRTETSERVAAGTRLRCGVRPEHLRLGTEASNEGAEARVIAAIFGGDATRCQVRVGDGGTELLAVLPAYADAPRDGETTRVSVDPGCALLFDEASGVRVGGGCE